MERIWNIFPLGRGKQRGAWYNYHVTTVRGRRENKYLEAEAMHTVRTGVPARKQPQHVLLGRMQAGISDL
jgi:hypothetical protein